MPEPVYVKNNTAYILYRHWSSRSNPYWAQISFISSLNYYERLSSSTDKEFENNSNAASLSFMLIYMFLVGLFTF